MWKLAKNTGSLQCVVLFNCGECRGGHYGTMDLGGQSWATSIANSSNPGACKGPTVWRKAKLYNAAEEPRRPSALEMTTAADLLVLLLLILALLLVIALLLLLETVLLLMLALVVAQLLQMLVVHVV